MNSVIPDAGFHHVALYTLDYERTVAFYTEVLGMNVAVAWTAPDGRRLALLDIGNGEYIEVIAQTADQGPASGQQHPWMHLALATSDPDAVWRRAVDAGCRSVLEPKDVHLDSVAARIAFFEGPNGEVIELFRRG